MNVPEYRGEYDDYPTIKLVEDDTPEARAEAAKSQEHMKELIKKWRKENTAKDA